MEGETTNGGGKKHRGRVPWGRASPAKPSKGNCRRKTKIDSLGCGKVGSLRREISPKKAIKKPKCSADGGKAVKSVRKDTKGLETVTRGLGSRGEKVGGQKGTYPGKGKVSEDGP